MSEKYKVETWEEWEIMLSSDFIRKHVEELKGWIDEQKNMAVLAERARCLKIVKTVAEESKRAVKRSKGMAAKSYHANQQSLAEAIAAGLAQPH